MCYLPRRCTCQEQGGEGERFDPRVARARRVAGLRYPTLLSPPKRGLFGALLLHAVVRLIDRSASIVLMILQGLGDHDIAIIAI